jgi:ribose transport system ATP-binding protein
LNSDILFRMENATKRYGGVVALNGASIALRRGRIHAVLGENGAGKSTLIKIMAGVVQPDSGNMNLDGHDVKFLSPAEANAQGIVCVFQELSLIPDLTVADNIIPANPPTRFGLIDRKAQRKLALEALARAGAEDIHPAAPVRDLSLSRRQMVEIAKALARKPKILILDEATSALTAADVEKVFSLLKRLKKEGVAIVYISHRMHEIEELADDCTVFRNGQMISTYEAGSKTDAEVIEMMIGREYHHDFPPKQVLDTAAAPALSCKGLSWQNRLRNISFELRPGEILGLGGLDGQGQKELLLALFGVLKHCTGEVTVGGRAALPGSPAAAKSDSFRMALIPEDRKMEGLLLPMAVGDNLIMAAHARVSSKGIVDRTKADAEMARLVQLLSIKTANLGIPVSSLSGGNQQKVVIAKWLMNQPAVILLNDPTRGIDVGTKQEMYTLLSELAKQGAAIILYSTDYDELIGLCQKVLVIFDGEISRVLEGKEISERNLVASALKLDAKPKRSAA